MTTLRRRLVFENLGYHIILLRELRDQIFGKDFFLTTLAKSITITVNINCTTRSKDDMMQ